MTDFSTKNEDRVANAFASAIDTRDDENRLTKLLRRIRAEIASRDVLLFVFVRIWLTVLEFGASIYAHRAQKG